jgi:hypothetical protein
MKPPWVSILPAACIIRRIERCPMMNNDYHLVALWKKTVSASMWLFERTKQQALVESSRQIVRSASTNKGHANIVA